MANYTDMWNTRPTPTAKYELGLAHGKTKLFNDRQANHPQYLAGFRDGLLAGLSPATLDALSLKI